MMNLMLAATSTVKELEKVPEHSLKELLDRARTLSYHPQNLYAELLLDSNSMREVLTLD